MKLVILRVGGKLYYSHHKSNLHPGVWYKEYRSGASFLLIYDEIVNWLTADKPYTTEKGTIIELVEGFNFMEFVQNESTRVMHTQLSIAI